MRIDEDMKTIEEKNKQIEELQREVSIWKKVSIDKDKKIEELNNIVKLNDVYDRIKTGTNMVENENYCLKKQIKELEGHLELHKKALANKNKRLKELEDYILYQQFLSQQ